MPVARKIFKNLLLEDRKAHLQISRNFHDSVKDTFHYFKRVQEKFEKMPLEIRKKFVEDLSGLTKKERIERWKKFLKELEQDKLNRSVKKKS